MKTPQLKQTKEYRLFLADETNRSPRKTKKIMASMKQWGFLPAHAIAVVPSGSRMKVKDGQHRLFCAQELGIPVYYVCSEDYANVSIPELNGATAGAWNPLDYVQSFCNQGKVEYAKLRSFVEEYKIPVGLAAGLLTGNQACSGSNEMEALRAGRFVVKDLNFATQVAAVIATVRHIFAPIGTRNFVNAISKALKVDGVTSAGLSEKIRRHPELLRNSGTTDGYLEILEEIFNFSSRHRIPLKFLAQEATKSRTPIEKNGKVKSVTKG